MTGSVLALDQGTTSSRAILFGSDMRAVATAQEEFPQYFPRSGCVEHDAREIWESVVRTARQAIESAGAASSAIAAAGDV